MGVSLFNFPSHRYFCYQIKFICSNTSCFETFILGTGTAVLKYLGISKPFPNAWKYWPSYLNFKERSCSYNEFISTLSLSLSNLSKMFYLEMSNTVIVSYSLFI